MLVNPLSVVRLECSFHILNVLFLMNILEAFFAPNAATFAKSECKISYFQQIGKRKNQKTQTFFVIFMKIRNFAPDF